MRSIHIFLVTIFMFLIVSSSKAQDKEIKRNPASMIDSCDFEMDTAYAGHLYREAKVLMDSGEYDLALENLKNAEQIYLATVGEVDTLTLKLCQLLGKLYYKKRNIEKAVYSIKRAINTGEILANSHPVLLADGYFLLATLFLREVQSDKALSYYPKALSLYIQVLGNKHSKVGDVYGNLGLVWRNKGNYDKALKYYDEALKIKFETLGSDHESVADTYHNLGQVWSDQGDNKKAISYYKKSLKIKLATFGDNHPKVGNTYYNLANIWKNSGDYEKAISYYTKDLEISLENLGEKHPFVASSYLGLAGIYSLKEDYQKALIYYEKALKTCLEAFGEKHPWVAETYHGLGNMWELQGEYDQALICYEKALALKLETLGYKHPKVGNINNDLGQFWSDRGNFDKAILYFEKALAIKLETLGEKHPKFAGTLINIGAVWRKKGNYSLAKQHIRMAMESLNYDSKDPDRFEQVSDPLVLQTLLFEKKSIMSKFFDSSMNTFMKDSVTHSFQELISLNDFIYKESSRVTSRQLKTSESLPIYEGAIDNFISMNINDQLPQIFRIIEKLKGRQLSEKMKEALYISSFGIPDSLKEREYDLDIDIAYYEKNKFKEKYESRGKSDSLLSIYEDKLFKLNQKRDALQELFKTQYPNYYNARYSQQVISVSGVQDSLLQTNQALLEYFVGDSSIFTFTVLRDTFYVQQIKKDFPLDRWVEDMLHGIYDPYTPGAETLEREYSFQQAASLIYQKVFHHVDTLLPEGTDIILVPDGILGYIPFDILLSDSTNSESYLIKDHQVSYAYSATLQAEMEKMEHDHQAQKKILAFAPSFDHKDLTGDTNMLASRFIDVSITRNWLGPLKYNDDEVSSISQMVPTDLFMDSTATKDQFLQHASDYSIIHLSTHGKANDKMGDYSFLAFYDPQDSSETWLYNRELYGLDLNADMVVLSACETGIGELQRGEGIISLARGFSYAGAKSIITTLWSVNDRSTQKVMELFYANLADGMPKDAALRQAKLDYLDQYPHLGKSPYFWAGIIPIGDMSPVEFSSGFSWWWMALGLIGVGLLLFWSKRKAIV